MRRVIATSLSLVMTLGLATQGGIAFFCTMDGALHSKACCCDGDEHADELGKPQLKLVADGCCSVRPIEGQSHRAVPHVAQDAPTSQLALNGNQTTAIQPPVANTRIGYEARGPPRVTGPPLFIRNCRIVI